MPSGTGDASGAGGPADQPTGTGGGTTPGSGSQDRCDGDAGRHHHGDGCCDDDESDGSNGSGQS